MFFIKKLAFSLLLVCLSFFVFMSMAYASGKQFNVLLFTKSAAWHHNSVLEGVSAIKTLSNRHSFSVEWHEDSQVFNAQSLAKYDVVIFLQTTGDILNDERSVEVQGAANGFHILLGCLLAGE